ncbi:hypothetical protein ABFB09_05540 [Dehalogenimonas sp. THU2]|uniref:hypothetical protein n=1 Tax=Dehalogenimonas sp. THU2 TaxID=3151121 RepID=UPI003218C656
MTIFSVRRTATFLIALALLVTPTPQPTAAADAKWSEVPLPQTGTAGSWYLTPETDVKHLVIDSASQVYAWVTGTEGGLFRTDASGENITRVFASVHTPVALELTDAGQFYYATDTTLYRSTDNGLSFQTVAAYPGGPGKRITGLSVDGTTGANIIAVSVADDDANEWGGVYFINEAEFFGGWIDSGLIAYNVFDVGFSPTFAVDRELLALGESAGDAYILLYNGGTWRAAALQHRDGSIVPATSGAITLPQDFNLTTNPQFYVAIDTGADAGGLWLCYARPAEAPAAYALPFSSPTDFSSLSVSGTSGAYSLLAGSASGEIFRSSDGGISWQSAVRNPGGQRVTAIASVDNMTFAATSGTGSGVFSSIDGGMNWLPDLFIDETGAGTLVTVVASPTYESDNTLYLLAFNGVHGVWRTDDDGLTWRKLLGIGDYRILTIDRLITAADGSLFIAATDADGALCLVSTDQGTTFSLIRLPVSIDTTAGFAALDKDNFFFTSFDGDGNIATIWRTGTGIFFENVATGSVKFNALELSPDFSTDRTLIAAASNGLAYISTDAGVTFSTLPATSLTGSILLTFDPDFGDSNKIYASSTDANTGIYRYKIGDAAWKRIDSGLPAGTLLSDLDVAPNGFIYAPSANNVSTSTGGLARVLTETAAWDLASEGLTDGVTLWGLSRNSHQLWSLDTTNNRIMTYTDTIASAVALTSPPASAPGLGTYYPSGIIGGIDLKWQSVSGATGYEWQMNDSADMTSPLFSGNSTASSIRLSLLEPGVTYHWRVRAVAPVPGPWSEKRSFTTALGGVVAVPQLLTPTPGATNLTPLPLFQWQPVGGATGYELLLATDAGFQNITASPANIVGNAWQPPAALTSATTYYWKIRAVSENSFSAWSAVSAFTTAAPATTAPTSPVVTSPVAPTVTVPIAPTMTMPDWLAFSLAGMGGAVVLLLLALVIVVKGKRTL